MTQDHGLGKIQLGKTMKVLFSISVVSMLGLSATLMSTSAEDSYSYVVATPTSVEKGEKATLTAIGYIYGDGKYSVSVEFWETDIYEDAHQSIDHLWTSPAKPDDSVGTCTASITVKAAGRFECSVEITPSELSKGNAEDEGDWTEYVATVSLNKGDGKKTGGVELIYCDYCGSSDEGIKGEG
jgi:hypothetical protein